LREWRKRQARWKKASPGASDIRGDDACLNDARRAV